MLEPLFRCNLACAGCGKIDYPDPILNRRLSVHDEREGSDHRALGNVADLRRTLENEIGIRLPDSAGLDAALARLP